MTDQFTPSSLESLGQRIDIEDDTKPLEIKPMPGFMKWMPQLIKDIHNQGATVTTDKNSDLRVQGFYGNNDMLLAENNGKWEAIDKNKKATPIATFDDLVMLNYDWWRQAQTRGNYVQPERPWLDKFRDKGLVDKKVIYVPREQA